jgi:hypothetical protein
MGGGKVEQLWYGLCPFKAIVILFVVSVVVLLCRRFLRCISWNRVMGRSAKHRMVHLLGTVQPTRKTANLGPGHIKRRIG